MFFPDFQEETEVIVIIPVLNDPDIFRTVDSLCCCSTTEGKAGVIILVNHSGQCSDVIREANKRLAIQLREYTAGINARHPDLQFYIAEAFDLPAKYAGVGLARKLAMDAAVWFFYSRGRGECPVLSLDADTDVEANYLDETVRCFRKNRLAGVSLAYAHRLDECKGEVCEAMISYELYLRYYEVALKDAGHPYAYPCIGSAFAVRASDYAAEGGMNRRQAGEDFYFLQKLIATGRYALLKSTKVYPSARFSDRTPFGTGRSVRQIVENKGSFPVYHPQAFQDLKVFFKDISGLYKTGKSAWMAYFNSQAAGVKAFLEQTEFLAIVEEIDANCASQEQFVKRFFDRFNAFRVLKYLNFVHEGFYEKIEIETAVKMLLCGRGIPPADKKAGNLKILAGL